MRLVSDAGSPDNPRARCQDWGCPAKWSCARAFCRSRAYAAMEHPGPKLFQGTRPAGADSCGLYRLDKPRPWLAAWFQIPRPKAAAP